MAYEIRFTAYSGSDWAEAFELRNLETGALLSEADDDLIELQVTDRSNSVLLSARTDDDTIENPSTGIFRWRFTKEQMSSLCAGTTYGVGMRLTNDTGTVALIAGSLAFLDGEF